MVFYFLLVFYFKEIRIYRKVVIVDKCIYGKYIIWKFCYSRERVVGIDKEGRGDSFYFEGVYD